MIELMKDIAIFWILVQFLLCLVPFGNYEKYLRVIAGIMLIVKLSIAVLSVFSKENVGKIMKDLEMQESSFWEEEAREEAMDDFKE